MKIDLKKVKTRTLLIYPPNPLRKKYLSYLPTFSSESFFVYPLGLAYLAGYLKSLGYKNIRTAHLGNLDCKGYGLGPFPTARAIIEKASDIGDRTDIALTKEIRSTLKEFKPQIVGFSILYSGQFYFALKIAEIIKSVNKDIFILFGGPYISLLEENIIKMGKLGNYLPKTVNGFMVNCGEEPLARLIENIDQGAPLENTPNLYFFDSNGHIKKSDHITYPRPDYFVTPDFGEAKLDFIPLRLSIGCYWGKCSFCNYCKIYPRYCAAEAVRTVKAMKILIKKHGINKFFIGDDAIHPLLLKKLSEEIIKEKLSVTWRLLFLIPDPLFIKDKSIAVLMKRAGCQAIIQFGLDSAVDRILKLMKKRHNTRTALTILSMFKKAGIDVGIGVTFGFPTETLDEAKKTAAFLKKHSGLYYLATLKKYFVVIKSEIADNPAKFHLAKKPMEESSRPIYLREKGMSIEDLDDFYNNYLMRELKKISGYKIIKLEKFQIIHFYKNEYIKKNIKEKI